MQWQALSRLHDASVHIKRNGLCANKSKNLWVFLQYNRSFVSIAEQSPFFKMLLSGNELQQGKTNNAARFKCKRTTKIGLVVSCVYSGVDCHQDRTRSHWIKEDVSKKNISKYTHTRANVLKERLHIDKQMPLISSSVVSNGTHRHINPLCVLKTDAESPSGERLCRRKWPLITLFIGI